MIKYDKEEFIRTCNESSSMSQAASKLGIHINTLSRIAKKLGCYKPNQGRKGIKRDKYEDEANRIPLNEILKGLHPSYQTFKLKLRLLDEGIKENKCEECDISEWNNKPLNCELDHIDGDRTNHKLKNLRMLCPNCHSQTSTHRAKNKKLNRIIKA